MEAWLEVGLRQGLRHVEADHQHRQSPAHADADRIFERRAPVVEGVAGVEKHGATEVAPEIAFEFDAGDDLVSIYSAAQIIMTQTLAMIYNELIELMGGLITEGNENE